MLFAVPQPNDDISMKLYFPHWAISENDEAKQSQKQAILASEISKERKLLKEAFGNCWTEVLKGEMDEQILRKVLRSFSDVILPFVSTPVTLVDFLDSAYSHGGIISVLSLRSVFELMIKHGLDVPDFYIKLYALISPETLSSKHRDEFFTLSEQFLGSDYIPAHTIASFAKKTLRVSLKSAPSAALITVMPFVSNLLLRHSKVRATLIANSSKNKKAVKKVEISSEAMEEEQEHTEGEEKEEISIEVEDLFDENESDPAKTHAIESTLWEGEILSEHFEPMVSRFSTIFKIHQEHEKQQRRIEGVADSAVLHSANEFTGMSFRTLFDTEATITQQQVQMSRKEGKDSVSLEFKGWNSLFGEPNTAFANDGFWILPNNPIASDVSADRLAP